MARPQIKLDEEKIWKLARRQWTHEEIAAFFNVSADTIARRYADLIEKARHAGRAKLKDTLWSQAFAAKRSDKIFLHAVNRFIGPIPKDIRIDLNKVTDDELAGIVMDRLGGTHATGVPDAVSEVSGEENEEAPPGDPSSPKVRPTKQIRRESSALSGRTMLKTRGKK